MRTNKIHLADFRCLLITLLLLVTAVPVFALNPIELSSEHRVIPDSQVGYLASAEPLSLAEVQWKQARGEIVFTQPGQGLIDPDNEHWYHLKVLPYADWIASQPHYLVAYSTLLEELDIHIYSSEKGLSSYRLGRSRPAHFTVPESGHFLAPLPMVAGEVTEIWIRVKTSYLYRGFPFVIEHASSFEHNSRLHGILLTAIYSILIALMVTNFLILLLLRERSLFFYGIFVVAATLILAQLDGTAFQYLWPDSPSINQWAFSLALTVAASAYLFFQIAFLRYDISRRSLAKFAKAIGLLTLASTIPVIVFEDVAWAWFNLILVTITAIVLLSILVHNIRLGTENAFFLSLSFFVGAGGVVVKLFSALGFIPVNILTYHGAAIGIISQGVFFTLCVVNRVRLSQAMRDEYYQLSQQAQQNASQVINESNRIKNNFLEIISHELRTPMNGVQGALELLDMTPLTQEGKNYLDIARQSTAEMMLLVDGVLSFAEIQAGLIQVNKRLFCLSKLLTPAASRVAERCRQKGITFVQDVSPDVPDFVWGDDRKLASIVAILLDNAVRYTQVGGVKLSLTVEPVIESQHLYQFKFEVADTGLGIDDIKQAQIFDRQAFSEPEDSHSAGLGIGLPLANELSKIVGGQLSVSSSPGQGSLFSFTLAMQVATEQQARIFQGDTRNDNYVSHRAEQSARDKQTLLRGCRVLIVEDNNVNAMVMMAILKKLNCEVVTVSDGHQALDYLQKQVVDIVLMDCQMPELDGYETTQRIRQGEAKEPQVPIIAVTANALEGNEKRCLAAGMNDYIKKPIRSDELCNKLLYWMRSNTRG